MKKADRLRFARMREMGCIVCLTYLGVQTPTEIHHPRDGQGGSQRAPDSEAFPLCPIHHRIGDGTPKFQGHWGYHHSSESFEKAYGNERFLLELTNKVLEKGIF